jgi:hypothetical protein
MSGSTPGSFRSKADRAKKLKGYQDTLDLQIELSKQQEMKTKQHQRNMDLGITPELPPIRSVEEDIQDFTLQKNTALKNLQAILPKDALGALNVLGDDIGELVLFNRNWEGFRERIKNQKLISVTFFRVLWDRYKEFLATTGDTGIDIPLAAIHLKRMPVGPGAAPGPGPTKADPPPFREESGESTLIILKGLRKFLVDLIDDYAKDAKPRPTFSKLPKNRQAQLNKFLGGTTGFAANRLLVNIIPELDENIDYWETVGPGAKRGPTSSSSSSSSTSSSGSGFTKRAQIVIRGKGLPTPPRAERYAGFGRYVIHTPSLQKGVFNVKYPSLANIAGLPQTRMSGGFRDFVTSVLQSGKMNMRAYRDLSDGERKLFNSACRRAGLEEVLGIDDDAFQNEEIRRQLVQRYNILTGEITAGNDSDLIKKELKKILINMLDMGLVNRSQALSLMVELL